VIILIFGMQETDLNNILIAVIGALGAILGAIVGGLLSYLGSLRAYKNQLKNEQKNIANAILLDLQKIEKSPTFFTAHKLYHESTYIINSYVYPDQKTHVPLDNLYDKDTGLYFYYIQDVTRLNSKLASDIYAFYNNLIAAENHRLFIQQVPDFIPINDPARVFRYREMAKLIIECGDSIPKLKEELSKVQKTWIIRLFSRMR
jgi:hypothetical protein